MNEYIIVVSMSDDKDELIRIGNILLERKLVAGIQLYDADSMYWWDDEIVIDKEYRLEARTVSNHFDAIRDIIIKEHHYDVCEVLSIPLNNLSDKFKNWIDNVVL